MAGNLTTQTKINIINYIFGRSYNNIPSYFYYGLSTTAIDADGNGITEPVDNGYYRATVSNDSSYFGYATSLIQSNSSPISFPLATGPWGELIYFFISDNSYGGNIIAYGSLTTPTVISNGMIARFDISDFEIEFL